MLEILYEKGVTQLALDDFPSSINTFNDLIIKNESSIFSAKAKVEIGVLELARGSYENAESLFKDIGDSNADEIGAKAQYYYGLTLFEQNKIDDAILAFVRVRSVFGAYDEWFSKSLLKLGDCYVILKDKKQAKEMYSAVIKRHKNDELGKEASKKVSDL